jgi:hypothetical protein
MSAVRAYLDAAFATQRQRSWTHSWDQWCYTDYFFDPDPAIMDRLNLVSDAGLGALTIALLEWQCFHFDSCDQAALAQEYADAAWIGLHSPGACAHVSLDHSEWAGPANGPLRAASLFVNDVLFDAAIDGQFALRACWAIRLARHCCEMSLLGNLEDWLAECIQRLVAIAPKVERVAPEDLFFPTFAPPAAVSPTQLSTAAPFLVVSMSRDMENHYSRIGFQNRFLRASNAVELN